MPNTIKKECNYPTLLEAFWVWIKIGLLSFGGPTGQISLMHKELVENRRWINDSRFLKALNFCMLLPGPEAQQLSIYIGWLLHGVRGGIIAGTLFVLPGALLIWLISLCYAFWGTLPLVASIFWGLKPVVVAIVFSALQRLVSKSLNNFLMYAVAIISFMSIFILKLPFPLIIGSSLILGVLLSYKKSHLLTHDEPHHTKDDQGQRNWLISEKTQGQIKQPNVRSSLIYFLFWALIWLLPLLICVLWFGSNSIIFQIASFFYKAALLTFGGAYAVLPYVAQAVVENYSWLTAEQMIDGLGLAETTPGPLILVIQFVGYMISWNSEQYGHSIFNATSIALMCTWITFIPGFLFIFVGAPWYEAARQNVQFNSVLQLVTAAVVGVILNLVVWFSLHTLIGQSGNIDFLAVLLVIAAFTLLKKYKWDTSWVVVVGGFIGAISYIWDSF